MGLFLAIASPVILALVLLYLFRLMLDPTQRLRRGATAKRLAVLGAWLMLLTTAYPVVDLGGVVMASGLAMLVGGVVSQKIQTKQKEAV
jgi:hypothetical protein